MWWWDVNSSAYMHTTWLFGTAQSKHSSHHVYYNPTDDYTLTIVCRDDKLTFDVYVDDMDARHHVGLIAEGFGYKVATFGTDELPVE